MSRSASKLLHPTPREVEILQLSACGKKSGEIAELLFITEDTVNTHIKNACNKLNAINKIHAVAIALVHGILIPWPSPELVIPLTRLFGLSSLSPTQRMESVLETLRHAKARTKTGSTKS